MANLTDVKEVVLKPIDIFSSLPESMTSGLEFIIKLGKIAGILIIIYVIFIIIKALLSLGKAHRIKKISNNVEEISKKLDILIRNLKPKKVKLEKIKKDKKKKKT